MHFDAITYSLLKDRKLRNVAPLCTVTTSGWTGSQSGEVLFTGDGTTKDFSGKVDLPPVHPLNSFVLHYTIGATSYSVTADEDGNLSDANMTGTINQDGTYEFHFNTAPDNGTDGTADYNHGIALTNLERALDPVNPQPSDWGWKTTSGSGIVGAVNIEIPWTGLYLVRFTVGVIYMTSGTFFAQFKTCALNKYPIDADALRNLSVSDTTERIRNSSVFSFYVSDYLLNLGFPYRLQIYFGTNTATEYKVRFHDISILKCL